MSFGFLSVSKWGHCLSSLSTSAMASTPDNKSTRPVSAPVMSPVSPGEASLSPLLPALPRSDHHDGCTTKGHSSADRKAEVKKEGQPAEYTKSHSPRPESTPEIKVMDGCLYITMCFMYNQAFTVFITEQKKGGSREPIIRDQGKRWRESTIPLSVHMDPLYLTVVYDEVLLWSSGANSVLDEKTFCCHCGQ